MILADTSITFEPAYPWSIPAIGPLAMLGVALALTALTVWTYFGVSKASVRRIGIVLALRLAALAIAFLLLLRPSLAITQLEGMAESKLLVVLDASRSMDVADAEGKPTRWQQMNALWNSSAVERRVQQLALEEEIEIVKYLGDRDVRPYEKDASPEGERTDIAAWLQQLWTKHNQDKHLRGVAVFSDGADNGTRYSLSEKARQWRGVAPIHAFGLGDPNNAKFKKDLGLAKLDIKPDTIFVKTPMKIEAVAQAPGFLKTDFQASIEIKPLGTQKIKLPEVNFKLTIAQEKDQKIQHTIEAPEEEGEYKITLKVGPHPDETNVENNEISTYFQVVKEKINVLWVDRPRVYEPRLIIQLALAPEERLKIKYVTVPADAKGDPAALYDFTKRYDVIIIGDISSEQFTLGDAKFLDAVRKSVVDHKTGLLMLGGSETFAKGGWAEHAAFMNILPVDFKTGKQAFSVTSAAPIRVKPTQTGQKEPFCQLDPDPKTNLRIWNDEFRPLKGAAPVGAVAKDATPLLVGEGKELILVATQSGLGRVAVFAGDSTATSWLGSETAARGFTRFWKQLVFWLANQEDRSNPLLVKLDRRRMTTDAADVLGFTMTLRDREGNELPRPTFTAKVTADGAEYPVKLDGKRGLFQHAKKIGEHELTVEASATDAKKNVITGKAVARFLVAPDRTETLRPLADHETLARIASASEGRFHPADEESLLRYLDELASQVKREGRVRTTKWPAWSRLPASDATRDQVLGLWNSFALFGFVIFVALIGTEWLLRRMWGLA